MQITWNEEDIDPFLTRLEVLPQKIDSKDLEPFFYYPNWNHPTWTAVWGWPLEDEHIVLTLEDAEQIVIMKFLKRFGHLYLD